MGNVIAGYVRESTTKESQDQPLEWHTTKLQRYGCTRIFTDRASGASRNRPAYNEMLALVERGDICEVVVSSLKRFGRSVAQIYQGVELIQSKGCKFTILDGSHDLSTAIGRAAFGLDALLAQLDRDLIQERINDGYQHMRENKIPLRGPFGYTVVNKKLIINEETRTIARWIRNSVIDVGLIKTCQQINIKYKDLKKIPKSVSGIKTWFKSETIYGNLQYNRHKNSTDQIIHYNNHEALFTPQERIELEKALAFRKKHHGFRADPVRFPFSGLITCGECESSMQVSYKANVKNPIIYYRCYKAIRNSCSNKNYIQMRVIEHAAINALISKASFILNRVNANTEAATFPGDSKIIELRNQLANLEAMQSPYVQSAIAEIKVALTHLETLNACNTGSIDENLLKSYANPEYWQDLSPKEKASTYKLLIKKVICKGFCVIEVGLWF